MRGPNYWSATRHKLIVMRLDIEEMEKFPTNKIEGFAERLENMFPSLYEHRCSENRMGGFFYRVKQGTWMGHVIEHIALELQTLSGMSCGFGRTRSTETEGVYNIIFSYSEKKAGIYAAKASVRIAEALIKAEDYDLKADLQMLQELRDEEALGPSTSAIVEEAVKRGIPCTRLNDHSLVMMGYGINQKRIQATISSCTSSIAVDLAGDKAETKRFLQQSGIPVPEGTVIYGVEGLLESIERFGFPLAVKPRDSNHGKGITINIKTTAQAVDALNIAKKISSSVIVERFISGFDYRMLVIDYRLVAVARRTPALVVGDGQLTIQQLIDKVNNDPKRGKGHRNVLTLIDVDAATLNILKEKKLTLDTVLNKNEILYLKPTANISTGGTATDVTDIVHPANISLAERVARIIGLDICGIDVVTADIAEPIDKNKGAVIEVNAAPGFRMHMSPTEGLSRNVAEPVVNMLFPPGRKFSIPIIAVTGTNGKTTTTRLIAHMAKIAQNKVGFATTDGIYIQDRLVEKGDCTGPRSAEFVLKEPSIDFAILECARGGILREGLGFNYCDIGIVTNVTEDHLGLKDIHTLKEMAKVKIVVPESVFPEGYAILNADDDLVYGMRKYLDCNIALFSIDENNSRIKKHCQAGGIAAIVENGDITICKGSWKTRIDKVVDIPLTFSGNALFMIQNILPSVITGFVRDFKIEDIRKALRTFIPSPKLTPGRMNLFQFSTFRVMVDYAHNPPGFEALAQFLNCIKDHPKIGVITGVGDRRDKDIINLGILAAQMFDEIIIKLDRDLRSRTAQEIINLIIKGIKQIDPILPTLVIQDEMEAVKYVIENAKSDSFIFVCCDDVTEVLDLIIEYQKKDRVSSHAELQPVLSTNYILQSRMHDYEFDY